MKKKYPKWLLMILFVIVGFIFLATILALISYLKTIIGIIFYNNPSGTIRTITAFIGTIVIEYFLFKGMNGLWINIKSKKSNS